MAETNGHTLATAPLPATQISLAPTGLEPGLATLAEFQPADFLHAFRRWWVVCVPIGLAFGGAAIAAAWFAQHPVYEAASLLRLSATPTELVFGDVRATEKFEIFQGTQRELAKSRFVMIAALRDPDVAKLPVVKREKRPVDWLASNIRITTPRDTEIMRVSLQDGDPDAIVNIVNAVVRAYNKEVVNSAHASRQDQLNQVDRIFNEKETELRRKRESLRALAERLQLSDSAALSVKQQMMVQELGTLRNELVRTQNEKRRAQAELRAAQAAKTALAESGEEERAVSPRALEMALASDPIYRSLLMDKMSALRMRSEAQSSFKHDLPDLGSKIQEAVDAQIEAHKATIIDQLRDIEPLQNGASIAEMELQVAVLTDLEELLLVEKEKLEDEIGVFGNQSIDIEMMRADIEDRERTLRSIAEEKEQLQVELRARPRVQLIRPASREEVVLANRTTRIALSGLAGLLAFFAPVGYILFRDVQTKRVNSSQDVCRFADLNVVGTVPLIPNQAVRQLSHVNGHRGRHAFWQTILSESVNRIASSLLVEANGTGPRMLLITSAVGGEGKTTLSTQLAMSLARAGRSVCIVDIDLRRPMIHRTFALPETPGICEVLRGEADLAETVQSTGMENLSAVPAGHCDRMTLRLLGHESTASLLKELRGLADFVIVDGCPVLPLADTGFICPHVDTVLFAVRRDVSRVTQVRAAHEFITKCGNNVLGAVVTEGTGSTYRDERYYQRPDAMS